MCIKETVKTGKFRLISGPNLWGAYKKCGLRPLTCAHDTAMGVGKLLVPGQDRKQG